MVDQDLEEHPSWQVRFERMETTMIEAMARISYHDRSLYGGINPETGAREPGIYEQLATVVTELKRITEILDSAKSFVEAFLKGFVFWVSRMSIMLLGGFSTVAWFLFTHWAVISHMFANAK